MSLNGTVSLAVSVTPVSALCRMRLDLGVGVMTNGGLELFWDHIAALVDVIEVEPQSLWVEVSDGWDLDPAAKARLAAFDRPLLAHGAGFPVGGQLPPDPRGVELFAECCQQLGALHTSEHLSFNRAELDGGIIHAGFPLPPRQNWETIDAAVCHIHQYQRRVGLPFLVETKTSYLAPGDDELTDGEFLRELVGRADCGVLLDLHNLWTNERTGRQPVADVLRAIPLDRVLEVHVGAGRNCDDVVLRMLADVLPMLPEVRAVVVDATCTELVEMGAEALRHQLETLHRVVDGSPLRSAGVAPMRRTSGRIPLAPLTSEAVWQAEVIDYTTRRSEIAPSTDPGFAVLRDLTDAARLSRLAVADRGLVSSLARQLGADSVEQVARRYLQECDAQLSTSSEAEARAFRRWLASQ